MLDQLTDILTWFEATAQKLIALFKKIYHDIYKEEKDFDSEDCEY